MKAAEGVCAFSLAYKYIYISKPFFVFCVHMLHVLCTANVSSCDELYCV